MDKFFEIFEDGIIFNRKIYAENNKENSTLNKSELPSNLNELQMQGTTLVLTCTGGNPLHFQNEWFYNFYVCASRSEKLSIGHIDNLLIVKENSHFVSFTINSLDEKQKNKIKFFEMNKIYKCDRIIVPVKYRNLKYRENKTTLWPEIRKNLWKSYELESQETRRKKVLIHNDVKNGREILNVSELINELKINNFEVQFINGYEWFKTKTSKEIMEVYYSADVYISPWGASFADCKITKESCKLIILKGKNLVGESWYFKSKNPHPDGDWSIEHIHTHDLNQEVFVVNCDWEKWQNPLVSTHWNLSIERTANLIVNIPEIIKIIQ